MNPQYKLTDAIELAARVFYDLNAKCRTFIFKHDRDKQTMVFTSVHDADLIKSIYPKFEIKLDTRQERYAELTINYVK